METLAPEALPPTPHVLFEAWHAEAEACEQIMYAGAMCLSTVAPGGFPDGRIVLLHAADAAGFAFFTDADSAKGRALAQTPRAALTFYWGPLERQVRVQGRVAPAPAAEADAFFAERPRRSKITAWASRQSRPLESAAALAQRMEAFEEKFEGRAAVPRPPYWKAYRVQPRAVEFWEARARRLHERVRYARAEEEEKNAWTITRLAP